LRLGSLPARFVLAIALSIVIGALVFIGLSTNQLDGYRLQVTDALQPVGKADPRVVVIAIDGKSIAQAGVSWPWPRSIHAKLLGKLTTATAVLYDVLFSPASPDDAKLAAAIAKTPNVVLSAETELAAKDKAPLYTTTALTLPVRKIAAPPASVGHANIVRDPADGVVRSVPLLVETPKGDLLPSLSFQTYARVAGLTEPYTIRSDGIATNGGFVPTERRTLLDVAYAPDLQLDVPKAPIVSAVDVLKGSVPPSRFDGKIVLIGATDPALGDHQPTPVAKSVEMPGVLVHANALNTMLTGQFLQHESNTGTVLYAAALAALVAIVTLVAPVVLGPIVMLVLLAAYVLWAFVRFDSGTILDLIYPPLAMIGAFVGALAIRYFTELRGRRRVSNLFSQYVPKGVADELLYQNRVDIAVRGERLNVTALFCDLRAFTAMSSRMEPTDLRDLLNIYYDETSRLIYEHEGTLLTYIGDEIFAVWGAPLPDDKGAERAVACARAMQDASAGLNERLAGAGLPSSVSYGIGVHTGEVVAAHVGTDVHRQYTILGDTVNCASRLCTIAGRNEVVVSAETYESLDDKPPATVLPGIKLKGVGRDLLPHRLWPDELRDPTGEQRQGKLDA
jgi:adenylate cyclase